MSNLASRKLLIALASVVVIGLNRKFALGLSDADVAAIVTIAGTGIGVQGTIDVLNSTKFMDVITAWISRGKQ